MRGPEAAIVLAGGKSRRLGRDKAAVAVGGTPLLARMVSLARLFCPTVAVAGRDPSPLVGDAPWFLDEIPGLGPMGGIITALERYKCPLLVLSCDLPKLDEKTLETLMDAWRLKPGHAVMTTFLQQDTGYIEALVSVYEPQAAPLLKDAAREGCLKLSRAVPPGLRHHVPYIPDPSGPFFNVNTQEDLSRLRSQD